MPKLLDKLTGGDLRSIGRSEEVVTDVLNDPSLFGELFAGLLDKDPLVRMRAADAVEKVTARHPEYLQPHKQKLLTRVAAIEQQEVRWHVAQLLPRLKLNAAERAGAVNTLIVYLADESRIVKTFAMQALADFAAQDERLRPRVVALLADLTRTGSPAMRSRGYKLLKQLKAGGS